VVKQGKKEGMETILRTFSIGFLLRSVFSGIFFVISWYVALHGQLELAKVEGAIVLSVALPVALFAGVTAYGIHRSLLYPFIESFFDSDLAKGWRKRKPLIRVSTIHTLLWRWNQDPKGTTFEPEGINERLNNWSDFIHLQYASAVCIAFGALVGIVVAPGWPPPHYPMIGLAKGQTQHSIRRSPGRH
jgi:hypothetical protein